MSQPNQDNLYNYDKLIMAGAVLLLAAGIFYGTTAHSEGQTVLKTGNKVAIVSTSAEIEAEAKAAVEAKKDQTKAEKEAARNERLSNEFNAKAEATNSTVDAIKNEAKSVGHGAAAAWDRTKADFHEGRAKAHMDNLNAAVSASTGISTSVK